MTEAVDIEAALAGKQVLRGRTKHTTCLLYTSDAADE